MKNKDLIRQAYLAIYENFAMDTVEVAKEIGISVDKTFRLLDSCDLVCCELIVDGASGQGITRKRFPGVPYTWQCHETYDYIGREEAEKLIDEWMKK